MMEQEYFHDRYGYTVFSSSHPIISIRIICGQSAIKAEIMKCFLYGLLFAVSAIAGTALASEIHVQAAVPEYSERSIKEAREHNCIRMYTGELTTSDTIISTCSNGKYVLESYVTRLCRGSECDNVRLRPFARVSYNCDDAPSAVSCI